VLRLRPSTRRAAARLAQGSAQHDVCVVFALLEENDWVLHKPYPLKNTRLHSSISFGTLPPMGEDKTERRANSGMRLAFRVFINVAVVLFLQTYFGSFFVLQGGYQGIAITALIFAILNMLVAPVLHVLSLPIKMLAWIIAFTIVNAVVVWLTIWFITALNLTDVSLAIEGGFVGWIFVSVILGVGNWVVKAIVK